MENNYITQWKNYINANIKAQLMFGEITEENKKEKIKEYAKKQIDLIWEKRPDKSKDIKEQCNKEQLEFIEWLEKIIETGELK